MGQNRQKNNRIKFNNKKIINWLWQILIAVLPVLLFLTSAVVSKWIKGQAAEYQGSIIAVLVLDGIYLICWGIWGACRIKFPVKRRRRKNWRWVFFTLLYTVGIRIVQIGDVQRWDASVYYNAIRNGCSSFDFTLRGFLEGFSVASHTTWGYMGILGIGEFLFEGNVVAVQVVNLILTVICVYCLYYIMRKLLPGENTKFIALSVVILSSLPVFAGTFSYCNPDMGVALFSVFMMFCYIRKKWILMFFCMLYAVASKETGILFVGGFTAGIFLWRIKSGNGNLFQRIRNAMKDYLCRGALIVGIAVLVAAVAYFGSGGRIWSLQSESREEFSTITIIPSFIWNNVKQFFILNFNWIGTAFAAGCMGGCIGKVVLEKNKIEITGESSERQEVIAGIVGAFFVNILFYCLYITFTLARYHIIIDILWNILILFCIGKYAGRIRLRNLVLSLYAVLLVWQVYVTVDPVSMMAFITHDTGSEVILTTQHPRDNLLTLTTGDYSVYNHHYNYASEAIEQILREVDYHKEMDIISFMPSEIQIDGILWDGLNEELTYKKSRETIPLNIINGNEVYQVESGTEAVYIYYSQNGENQEENMEHLRWYYDFYYRGEVKIQYGGTFYYWVGRRY